MQIKFFGSVWGYVDSSSEYDAKFARLKAAGYDGVEGGPPEVEPSAWSELLAKHQLEFVGMIFPFTGEDFVKQLKAILPYKPIMLCVHSGRDRMTFEDGCQYLETALAAEKDHGVPVAHELHRGRMFCNPWQTVRYVEKFADLRFCADFSHFVTVCESLLNDHVGDMIAPIIDRSIEIHARVGHEEGPQVPDPRAPEWAQHVETHMQWWDRIKAAREADGSAVLPVDPEFGGDPYLPRLPYTQTPMIDLWDVRLWMVKQLKQRWKMG